MSAATVLVALVALAAPVAAHAPDPFFGAGPMPQDHPFQFQWRANRVPPSWMQPAINAGAADSNASRLSRAPTFGQAATSSNWVMYGLDVGCGVDGLACFTRDVPTRTFTMSFRPQGYQFDWGALRWCQAYSSWPNGCYDVENVALDEFGHVTGLHHHQNYDPPTDYLDAVVQTVSRTKPNAGWNAHQYGRCDVARLQQFYDVPTFATRISTCISLTTGLTISAPTSVSYGATATFTARLSITATSGSYELGGNWLDSRTVVLQRRPIGGAWVTVATMAPGSSGTYTTRFTLRTTAEWRAVFSAPSNEGLKASTSPLVRVTVVGSCTGSGCPI